MGGCMTFDVSQGHLCIETSNSIKCRYDKGEVIVDLQSVFDGAFPDMKIKTISKQVFDISKKD
jgi:hypothetical protein